MTGPTINEKAKSFCDYMKVTDKHTFSEDWLQNLGTVYNCEYLTIQYMSSLVGAGLKGILLYF